MLGSIRILLEAMEGRATTVYSVAFAVPQSARCGTVTLYLGGFEEFVRAKLFKMVARSCTSTESFCASNWRNAWNQAPKIAICQN
jgi:hypothetical protein